MFYDETSVPEVVKNLHKPEWVTPVDDVYTILKELRQEVEELSYDYENDGGAVQRVLALIDTKLNETPNTQKETEKGNN